MKLFYFVVIIALTFACEDLIPYEQGNTHGYVTEIFIDAADTYRDGCNSTDPAIPSHRGQSAIYHENCLVLSLWCGTMDGTLNTAEITNSSLMDPWSVTKLFGSIVLMHLHSVGAIVYNQTMRHYWSNFANPLLQSAKAGITVQQMFSNNAMLNYLDIPLLDTDLRIGSDWNKMKLYLELQNAYETYFDTATIGLKTCNIGASQCFGYSPIIWGYYLDAFVRQVDGRNISKYLWDEIIGPIGNDVEVYYGFDISNNTLQNRCVKMSNGGSGTGSPNATASNWLLLALANPLTPQHKALLNPAIWFVDTQVSLTYWNSPLTKDVYSPAGTSWTNALSVAKILNYLANSGTVNNHTLISNSSIVIGSQNLFHGMDIMTYSDARYQMSGQTGNSYAYNVTVNTDEGSNHSGYGGSVAYYDRKCKVAVAYLTAVLISGGTNTSYLPQNSNDFVRSVANIVDNLC